MGFGTTDFLVKLHFSLYILSVEISFSKECECEPNDT